MYNRDDRGLKPLFPPEIILPVPQLSPVLKRIYRFIHTKRGTAKYAQRSKKGRATRKGMDGGKGGQTLSLQEREGENRKQSANLGEKETKKRDQAPISRARAIPGREMGRPEGA